MNSKQYLSELAFAKQFLITETTYCQNMLKGWRRLLIDKKYTLHCHPKLAIGCANSANNQIIGVGTYLDPARPCATNADILQHLASQAETFDTLEQLVSMLSGRWALFATINGETRIYPDATAQKPIFYSRQRSLFISSHPALLNKLGVIHYDHDLAQQFSEDKHSGSWPIGVSPYVGVNQLKPNHYLSLDDAAAHRFWPQKPLENKDRAESAQQMCGLLQGAIESALNRRTCTLSLTGGYDSRVLLACAERYWSDIQLFTSVWKDTPHHDISIPRALVRRLA